MSDWTSGYVADIDYTFGYYNELNPLRINLAFINAGLRPPDVINACELGFGQGMSTNLHAAASNINWYGTDFNPNQAAFAQHLANISQSDAKLYDDAFDEFASREELPEFDFIGLHGIWSWISDENRTIVVDFIRRKLKVGGVLYISYNTQPGWAAMVPMRDLLVEHSDVMSASGAGILTRVDEAMEFADKLLKTNPRFAQDNPQIKGRIEKMRGDNKHYLAHEYFNRDWEPMGFSKMASWLSPAKLKWATSARYTDNIDNIQLSEDQRALLNSISDPMFSETVKDFCTNRMFRTDLWVKGGRRLSMIEQQDMLEQQRVMLTASPDSIELKITTSQGGFTLREDIYNPVIEVLADHQPISVGELRKRLEGHNISLAALGNAITILAAKGALEAVQQDTDIEKAKPTSHRLNRHLLNQVRSGNETNLLASPVTGGGVRISLFHQMFLLAYIEGTTAPQSMADNAWSILSAQNKLVIKEGKTLSEPQDNIDELTRLATKFNKQVLPIYQTLQVIPE
ncbi:class I SAM-dependent methyltransferase [Halomonas halocynthiae]|uniref:class I SAM-dependent methyltransferase n=1 Tax=Halomonas halocynthiae TaxID=176290 RepID=UPI0003FFB2C5|nr:methyltransferase regulatory domain-containing protein [Halomonas halocynthiae]